MWKKLDRRFPQGSRVELVRMDAENAPSAGTRGTVVGVTRECRVQVFWDNGSGLSVEWGADEIRKVCPRCGESYDGHPAVSRVDRRDICPVCGIREALEAVK